MIVTTLLLMINNYRNNYHGRERYFDEDLEFIQRMFERYSRRQPIPLAEAENNELLETLLYFQKGALYDLGIIAEGEREQKGGASDCYYQILEEARLKAWEHIEIVTESTTSLPGNSVVTPEILKRIIDSLNEVRDSHRQLMENAPPVGLPNPAEPAAPLMDIVQRSPSPWELPFPAELASILLYLVIGLLLSLILIGVSFAFTPKGSAYPDKLSAYECGFDPFDDARSRFDIRFYLVSLLFIIFDLEVTFLFPWAVSLNKIGWFGFWSMMVFVWILTIGFLYEWKKGALDWE